MIAYLLDTAPSCHTGIVLLQANPFDHNPYFLEELKSFVPPSWHKDVSEQWQPLHPSNNCDGTSSLPTDDSDEMLLEGSRFVPLGVWSDGERLISCDPTGAPHQPLLVPIARVWAQLFGSSRKLPLWLSFTPGAMFAVSLSAARARSRSFYERGLHECGLNIGVDPISGHAFERLWRYIFDCSVS